MKKQLFIFNLVLAMASSVTAFDERSMFDETSQASNWSFLEKKFILEPATEKNLIWYYVNSLATGLFIGQTLGTYSKLSSDQLNDNISKKMLSTGNVLIGLGSAATLVSATSALDCFLSIRVNRNALVSFFNNYDQNQFFVPTELQEAFDLINESIKSDEKKSILDNATEIVKMIQFHVMRHFEKRYEKVLQATAITALADAKTASEILKNSLESISKLGGNSK